MRRPGTDENNVQKAGRPRQCRRCPLPTRRWPAIRSFRRCRTCRLGQPAVAHLVDHLGRSKGERARVRLVEALAAIGPKLSNPEVVNLMMTLSIRVERDPSERVRDAGAQAIATLRRVTTLNATRNESAAG